MLVNDRMTWFFVVSNICCQNILANQELSTEKTDTYLKKICLAPESQGVLCDLIIIFVSEKGIKPKSGRKYFKVK